MLLGIYVSFPSSVTQRPKRKKDWSTWTVARSKTLSRTFSAVDGIKTNRIKTPKTREPHLATNFHRSRRRKTGTRYGWEMEIRVWFFIVSLKSCIPRSLSYSINWLNWIWLTAKAALGIIQASTGMTHWYRPTMFSFLIFFFLILFLFSQPLWRFGQTTTPELRVCIPLFYTTWISWDVMVSLIHSPCTLLPNPSNPSLWWKTFPTFAVFHASHRFEPIKMALSAMHFLGCLRDVLHALFWFWWIGLVLIVEGL